MTVTPARKVLARTLGLVVALAPLSLSAAERLEAIVVTATREQQRLRDVAGSITVVSSEEIELIGATHHSEIVNRAPGAMIQRNSGQESLTAIRSPVLTGPGSCGVFLFLENSIPIRPTGFCNVNELFEVHLEQAASIEVLRGPAGVVYGSGAMHGAINVIQPEPAQLPASALALEAGPDDYYRGKLAFAHQGRNVDVGATLLAAHDGGWRTSSGIEEQKLSASLTRRFEESVLDLHLAITNLNQETAGFIQGFEAYRDETIARSNPNPEAYRDAYAVRLSGRYAMPLGDRAQLIVRPYARHSRMDFLQHFLIGKPLEENGQDSLGVLATFDIRSFKDTRLLAGLDLERAEGFLEETQAGPATDGPPAANLIRPAGKHYDYEVQSQVAALYGLLEQPLAPQLKLTAGVRFEHVRYDYDNRMLSGNTRDDGTPCAPEGCLYHRPEDRTDDFSNLTSKLGLTYALSDAHTLYVSAARGYRAPDTSELYRLQRQQSMADLDAERLDSIELGIRGAFGSLSYSLAAFVMEKDNVIFRDSNAFNVSDGRTDHEGIEYEIAWLPMDTLSLALSGTYAEHTYDFDAMEGSELIVAGREIDTAPRHIQNARLTWRFVPAATAELEWQSIGRYFLDASNEHEYSGHDLLNLRVGWDMARSWRTIVRVTNLTDRKYADRADFAFGNYRYFPGRDRSVFVELSYRSQ